MSRRVPYTVWALALCAVAWVPFLIGPGGPERLERWDTTALASLALGVTVGALADHVHRRRATRDD
ncbi:hypothetical protein JHN49_04540 [Streptomyces sp. MBT57]|nr:hypothetical protein [Streptomyces sp. MBT57]